MAFRLLHCLSPGRDWPWSLAALLGAAVVAVPMGAVIWLAFNPSENIWPHLAATILPRYVSNTLVLMAGVGIGVLVIGTGTAWLVTMFAIPGRRVLEWALLLPMAIPAYIIAYVYTDLLEYAGPVQQTLRAWFGWVTPRDYWFPEIRSQGGAMAMLTLVLYPYVYLMARAAFLQQSVCVLEASRVLGSSLGRTFLTVALPLARPALAAGVALAMMETLNDYGTISYFGVHTLTAGIFEVWLGMGNAGAAAQIALVMAGFVVVLLTLERVSRRRQRFHETATRTRPLVGFVLPPWQRWLAFVACVLPVLFGFVVPALVLGRYAWQRFDESWTDAFFSYASNSILLAATAALLSVALALLLAYANRLNGSRLVRGASVFAASGYALPGAVVALGVLIPFGALDRSVDAIAHSLFGVSTGLLLSGTVAAVIFAYIVRFLAVAYGAVDASFGKVTPHMDAAARTLGHGPWGVLRRIQLPLVRGGLLTGALLVFVDVMKELPATLLLRPFNFDTLATYVYQFASDELLEQCALGALTIVLAGVLPVILLSAAIRRARPT